MTYSHRNGETEPPEVTGWYWVKQKSRPYNLRIRSLLYVVKGRKTKIAMAVIDDVPAIPVTEIKAQWWGPVTPPWDEVA